MPGCSLGFMLGAVGNPLWLYLGGWTAGVAAGLESCKIKAKSSLTGRPLSSAYFDIRSHSIALFSIKAILSHSEVLVMCIGLYFLRPSSYFE